GLRSGGPFGDLPAGRSVEPRVIAWEAVSAEDGTGLVHIAPGCGLEDFELGRREGLPVIAAVDEEGHYLDGFGPLAGTSVLSAATAVGRQLDASRLLFARASYRHPYPTCLAVGQELVVLCPARG